MNSVCHNLLLADDDIDDCIFFKEALEDIDLESSLVTVNDGVELMEYLSKNEDNLPDILFLDLNMPRKTGYDCLSEIRACEKFKSLPVIVFSTSYDQEIVNLLFERGAHHYIRKPAEFQKLKRLLHKVITLTCSDEKPPQAKEHFVLNNT